MLLREFLAMLIWSVYSNTYWNKNNVGDELKRYLFMFLLS